MSKKEIKRFDYQKAIKFDASNQINSSLANVALLECICKAIVILILNRLFLNTYISKSVNCLIFFILQQLFCAKPQFWYLIWYILEIYFRNKETLFILYQIIILSKLSQFNLKYQYLRWYYNLYNHLSLKSIISFQVQGLCKIKPTKDVIPITIMNLVFIYR